MRRTLRMRRSRRKKVRDVDLSGAPANIRFKCDHHMLTFSWICMARKSFVSLPESWGVSRSSSSAPSAGASRSNGFNCPAGDLYVMVDRFVYVMVIFPPRIPTTVSLPEGWKHNKGKLWSLKKNKLKNTLESFVLTSNKIRKWWKRKDDGKDDDD